MRGEDTVREVECTKVIPGSYILTDILVKKLQDERNTISEDQVLAYILKLVYMVPFEVLQQEQQCGRHSLHNDLLVSVDVQSDLIRLRHTCWVLGGEHVHEDVQGVCVTCPGGGGGGQQDLEQRYHVLGEVGKECAVETLCGVVSLRKRNFLAV